MGERRFCVGHATTRRVSSVSSCGLLTFLCLRPLLLLPASAFSLPTFPTALFIFFRPRPSPGAILSTDFPTATVSWDDSFHGFSDGGRCAFPDSPPRIRREKVSRRSPDSSQKNLQGLPGSIAKESALRSSPRTPKGSWRFARSGTRKTKRLGVRPARWRKTSTRCSSGQSRPRTSARQSRSSSMERTPTREISARRPSRMGQD